MFLSKMVYSNSKWFRQFRNGLVADVKMDQTNKNRFNLFNWESICLRYGLMIRSHDKRFSLFQNGLIKGGMVEGNDKWFNSTTNGSTDCQMVQLTVTWFNAEINSAIAGWLIQYKKATHSWKQQITSRNVKLFNHGTNGPLLCEMIQWN